MSASRFLLIAILLIGVQAARAQQDACKPNEVAIGVISATGDTFRGLHPEDFAGRIQQKPLSVKSLTYDEGPRRIMIVMDRNKKLSADSRRAESEMLDAILASARSEDTFGLIPARGPGRIADFTADHAAITQALAADDTKNKDLGVLDAVMAGIEHFTAPKMKLGDSIILIAADTEGNHKSNAKSVAKALDEHRIRLFALALGPVATRNITAGGSVTSTMSQGLAWTTPGIGDIVYDNGDGNFFPLTVNSGGLVLGVMNLDQRRTYNLSDPHLLQEVRQKARSVSKMINSVYRMEIDALPLVRPEGLSLDIAESLKKHTQPMFVLYPHMLENCSGIQVAQK